MLKWMRRIAGGVVCAALVVIILAPWAVYGLALRKITGRPSHASNSVYTAEDAEALWRKLREPLPIKVEPQSPYSYLWAVVHGDSRLLPSGSQLAWMVARSYNSEHLEDHGWWHPSGAALTIWLTRNWTANELMAKGIELDQRSKHPVVR